MFQRATKTANPVIRLFEFREVLKIRPFRQYTELFQKPGEFLNGVGYIFGAWILPQHPLPGNSATYRIYRPEVLYG
jgi:hypothetical protein